MATGSAKDGAGRNDQSCFRLSSSINALYSHAITRQSHHRHRQHDRHRRSDRARVVAEGGRVVIHGRDAERGQAIVDEFPGRATFVSRRPGRSGRAGAARRRGDQSVRQARRRREQRRVGRPQRSAHTDAAFFDRMMAINVRAPLLLIKAAYPHLKQSQGCVLNIGSINAYTGERNLLAYSISKGALMTLSRNLADALCYDQIRVNHFNVGWVLTPNEYKQKIADGLPADWPEQSRAAVRAVGPDHVAGEDRRRGRLLAVRREPADQRQRDRAGAVPDDRPQPGEERRLMPQLAAFPKAYMDHCASTAR